MSSSNEEEQMYISTLSTTELKTMDIAISHLGSSFNIRKSNGFLKWRENNNIATEIIVATENKKPKKKLKIVDCI